MFHHGSTWRLVRITSLDELAVRLSEGTWTCCTETELRGYVFLNEALSADGDQEYAVLKRPTTAAGQWVQFDCSSFGWCDVDQGL